MRVEHSKPRTGFRAVWVLTAFVALGAIAGHAPRALAMADLDGNRIDDRIDRVHAAGWAAAFEDRNPAKRMRIGVENASAPTFAIYVAYDRRPAASDGGALHGAGLDMTWPFHSVDVIESRASYEQIQQVLALPGVKYVEAVPVDYVANHYGSRVVRARGSSGLSKSEDGALFPSAREELGLDGEGIVVAILDTGVNDAPDAILPGYPGHEGLQGKFLGGGEFWCGLAPCSTPLEGSANPQDHGAEASSYHGTHCAGTIMGTGGPGGFFAGVAPGARLVDCKVLSDAGVSVGGANRGLDWCIANRDRLWAGLPAGSMWQGIDVVSMSLGSTECAGGSGTSDGVGSELIDTAVDAGLVVVIATGNDGATECIASPAAADHSIAVGASETLRTLDRSDDRVTTFSNEGPRDSDGDADAIDEMKPSVVAPGAGIISANGDPLTDGSSYHQLSGTSMATPHVAGCVALVLQANPALTPLQVRDILQNTAEHNVPSAKVSGDRGQDPFGVDANYDPSCGWGLVDVFAAAKEALNATTGVQVVQIRAAARPQDARIDVRWVTQREHPFLGFHVLRAPDVNGSPGAFTPITSTPIAPAGDPAIAGDDNRTHYAIEDADPTLALGQRYWYRVDWLDSGDVPHAEPPVSVEYGELARIATARYSIVHDAADNDLTIRVGGDRDYMPGSFGDADFEVPGPGESQQDSSRVVLPSNPASAILGTVEHFWSVGFQQGDPAEAFLPPSGWDPWFLSVTDGGYINRTGRVTGFSVFVNDAPGSATGTTYVTDHQPMPQLLIEGGMTAATLWIPERQNLGLPAPADARVTFAEAPRPNPAVRRTWLSFVIGSGAPAQVAVDVHDLQGRRVRSLYRERLDAGRYSVEWNTADDHGTPVRAGVYTLGFTAGDVRQWRRVVIVR